MKIGPKISIITACYNAEKTIEHTIQSVVAQTYDDIEYIIIDGASTDSTMDIVNKYKDQIDIIISEPDKGIYDAFNKGIKAATGDFINFMNADDYFYDDEVLEEIAITLKKNDHIVMLHGNVKAIDEHTGNWHFRGENLTLQDFEMGKMCPHQSVFTKKEIFEKFSYFDLTYKILADIDFTIKCFQNYEANIMYVPITVAVFRLGGVSTNLEHEKKMHLENKEIHLKYFNSVPVYTESIIKDFDRYIIQQYHLKWLELLSISDEQLKGVFQPLIEKKIAIFGTKIAATNCYKTLKRAGINVVNFIDNDQRMQGEIMHGKPIIAPISIQNDQISTVIITIENSKSRELVFNQLESLSKGIDIHSWYEFL